MAAASERTERVQYVNANWTPGDAGAIGEFELLVVCESGARHSLPMIAQEAVAVVALTQAGDVLMFDAESRTLIVANLVGEWIQSSWSAGDRRAVENPTGGWHREQSWAGRSRGSRHRRQLYVGRFAPPLAEVGRPAQPR